MRYDERYARAIGKWTLNAANSQLLLRQRPPRGPTDRPGLAAANDPNSTLAYEGIRRIQSHIGRITADYRTVHGEITAGTYQATIFTDKRSQVLASTDHLASSASSTSGPSPCNRPIGINSACWQRPTRSRARLSWATQAEGPYTPLFDYSETTPTAKQAELDTAAPTLYLKLETTSSAPDQRARFAIDDLWILSTSDKSPYATGDAKENGWAATNFGLYASVFTGLLGGIVETTNVERILRLDCRATDYFGAPAYPTYLYYNPYPESKTVQINPGAETIDLYDAQRPLPAARRQRSDRAVTAGRYRMPDCLCAERWQRTLRRTGAPAGE